MHCFATLSVLLAFFCASHIAKAQDCSPSCPPVEVTASVLGGGTVTIPASLMPAFHLGQPPNSPGAAQIDSLSIDMTKEQVCKMLNDNKPTNCTTTTYPDAPGIPSASGAPWYGNGCGADPWSSALAAGYLTLMLPGVFSGDLNKPVEGNPSIDFTGICNNHDRGYTSHVSQQTVDNHFASGLNSFCGGSTNPQLCGGFAATYVGAVKKYGNAAYAADQAQLQCAAWDDSMKKDQCSS